MALGEHQGEPSILEAMEYLSSMAEVDARPSESKIIKINWLDPNQVEENQEVVRQTFKVIHHYLQDIFEKNRPLLQELETVRGVQAIMVMAKEAAQKLDKYTQLFKAIHGGEGVAKLKEYKTLEHFYLTEIAPYVREKKEPSVKEAAKKVELKDLDTVRQDRHYELFLIKNEKGQPFFSKSLLSHLKLMGEFEGLASSTEEVEDPFVHFRQFQDQELNKAAQEIIQLARPRIDEFYKEAMEFKGRELVSSLNKALMALMLAAKEINLVGNDHGKSCFDYYADFQRYLREALSSPAYSRLIAFPPEPSDHFSHTLLNLAHALCCFFFFRLLHDHSISRFVHQLTGRKTEEMWTNWSSEDEQIRQKLKSFPHGPLRKSYEFIEKDELKEGFDPLLQENFPLQLFYFFQDNMHVSVLRTPCPTKQKEVNQAEIVPEFKGLLRYLKETKSKHLMINLQDRNEASGEKARCIAVEQLQYDPEFADQLVVVTLSNHIDEKIDNAAEFKEKLKDQFFNPEPAGIFFPESLKIGELQEWTEKLIHQVHRSFFDSREILKREERLAFIEIFHQFFVLKLVERSGCDSMSFVSKDGLDTGAASNGCFYAFLRLVTSDKKWSEEEKDFLLWLFYYFALMVRERPINKAVLERALSAISVLHFKIQEDRTDLIQLFSNFYIDFDLNKINIKKI